MAMHAAGCNNEHHVQFSSTYLVYLIYSYRMYCTFISLLLVVVELAHKYLAASPLQELLSSVTYILGHSK